MLDPFPAPPPLITRYVEPLASALSLPTLPLHAHEILFAFSLYQLVNACISPWVSSRVFPNTYPRLNRRTRINWDVHAVSLVQSLIVNTLALWVIWKDDERRAADWRGRVWGYTGAAGLVQGFAAGYFLWDLMITARYVGIFGWDMLAHAICALIVFGFGFRPFVNYYGPVFILYELMSPFLNIHWFFDKLQMTGTRAQLYNGLILLTVFFSCRLVWGTYQTYHVFQDVWKAIQVTSSSSPAYSATPDKPETAAANTTLHQSQSASDELMRFAGPQLVPWWLATMYLSSNIILTCLNFFWFKKMIDAVRKRFTPAAGDTKEEEEKKKRAVKAKEEELVAVHEEPDTRILRGKHDPNTNLKVTLRTTGTKGRQVVEMEHTRTFEGDDGGDQQSRTFKTTLGRDEDGLQQQQQQPQQQQRQRRRYA